MNNRRDDSHSGPFPFEAKVDIPPVIRASECPFGAECLDRAARKGWANFTCAGCDRLSGPAYVSVFDQVDGQRLLSHFEKRVPLGMYLRKVRKNYLYVGYEEDSFGTRVLDEILYYYGERSVEYQYMKMQVRIIQAVLGESQESVGQMNIACIEMRERHQFPDFCQMFLEIYGRQWLTRSY